jgi:hypothetical protein
LNRAGVISLFLSLRSSALFYFCARSIRLPRSPAYRQALFCNLESALFCQVRCSRLRPRLYWRESGGLLCERRTRTNLPSHRVRHRRFDWSATSPIVMSDAAPPTLSFRPEPTVRSGEISSRPRCDAFEARFLDGACPEQGRRTRNDNETSGVPLGRASWVAGPAPPDCLGACQVFRRRLTDAARFRAHALRMAACAARARLQYSLLRNLMSSSGM